MKKILILLTPLLFLASCWGCDTIQCLEAEQNLLESRANIRAIEMQNMLEIKKIEAEIQANKPVEHKILEQQKNQAKSLEYLETSKKVHDTIDVVTIWIGVASLLFD